MEITIQDLKEALSESGAADEVSDFDALVEAVGDLLFIEYDAGYSEGYEQGTQEGFDEGYGSGYNAGLDAAEEGAA